MAALHRAILWGQKYHRRSFESLFFKASTTGQMCPMASIISGGFLYFKESRSDIIHDMSLKNFLKFVFAVALCEFAGAIGIILTVSAMDRWYANLAKPMLNPPSWIFGPVWMTLYLLIGIALFLVLQKNTARKEIINALGIFSIQLFLTAIWSVIFFGFQNPAVAFVDIAVLWFAIVWTIVAFSKISPAATYLLLPYLAWVSFAAYLNYAIWMLNR
jgi:tryptophan-rich sensory protein